MSGEQRWGRLWPGHSLVMPRVWGNGGSSLINSETRNQHSCGDRTRSRSAAHQRCNLRYGLTGHIWLIQFVVSATFYTQVLNGALAGSRDPPRQPGQPAINMPEPGRSQCHHRSDVLPMKSYRSQSRMRLKILLIQEVGGLFLCADLKHHAFRHLHVQGNQTQL